MTKQIPLTQGKFAIVDDEDYEYLSQWLWYAIRHKGYFYASRANSIKANGVKKNILMHRVILNAQEDMLVDHENGNTLDNRKSNLRQASHCENMRNRKIQSNNTSGFRGVSFHKLSKKWHAKISVNGYPKSLGYYETPKEASMVYEKEAERIYGKYRRK